MIPFVVCRAARKERRARSVRVRERGCERDARARAEGPRGLAPRRRIPLAPMTHKDSQQFKLGLGVFITI